MPATNRREIKTNITNIYILKYRSANDEVTPSILPVLF